MKRPTRRLGAALLATAVTLAPAALANGRFPRAERLIEHPSDPNQLVLGATYGLLVTRDRGANWHFVCEASFAHDPSYMGDPLLDYLGDGSLIVGVQTSMSVSSDQACDWIPTLREADAFLVDHAVAKSNRSTVVAAAAVSTGGMVKSTLRESLDGRFAEVVTHATACSVDHTANSNSGGPASLGEARSTGADGNAPFCPAQPTAYPSASAFSRTRTSLVTTTINGGGSPSNSVVARCTASSVRIGSTGNGLRTRARTASVTPTR